MNKNQVSTASWSFEKGMGSAELNSMTSGSMKFTLSSEFATPFVHEDCQSGSTLGGMYLFKLNNLDAKQNDFVNLTVSWKNLEGMRQQSFKIPVTGKIPLWQRNNIRKAVALQKYVGMQSDYCLKDEVKVDVNNITSLKSKKEIHTATLKKFMDFEAWLTTELLETGDKSLSGSNKATSETIQQIVKFEKIEIANVEKNIKSLDQRRELQQRRKSVLDSIPEENLPSSFRCSITRELMCDPVMLCDGHTYERKAMETWMKTSDISPNTGKKLLNHTVTPNHSLRKAIEEYIDKQTQLSSKQQKRNLRSSSKKRRVPGGESSVSLEQKRKK